MLFSGGRLAALLVGRRSIKSRHGGIPPRALQQPQISSNAPVPHFVIGSKTNLSVWSRMDCPDGWFGLFMFNDADGAVRQISSAIDAI